MNAGVWRHFSLSAGLALAVAGLGAFILIWPALSLRTALNERLETLQINHQKFTRTAVRTQDLEKELAELTGLEEKQEGFLQEKPVSLAAADLQKLVEALVAETGGILLSTQVLQFDDEAAHFPAITLTVHLRGAIETVQQLLYRIDSSQLLLLLDNLLLQESHREQRAANEAPQLDVRFNVTAFIYQARNG